MKAKLLSLLLAVVMICSLCTACSSSVVSVDGTWYSVTDATMYNFKNGEITVSGVVVGQYENEDDMVIISLLDTIGNLKLYITTMNGINVLADVREGEGTIYFCHGLENAEAMIAEAVQKEEEMLQNFPQYVGEHLFGEWVPIKENADYKSIIIESDGTLTFTAQDGKVWQQKLIFNNDGTFQASDLRMEDRGYLSPTITLHMSDDGTSKKINKMSVFAIEETYNEDYPALGFYGWGYRQK